VTRWIIHVLSQLVIASFINDTKKVITRTKRYAVHDSQLQASIGDQVRIRETRPVSKTKNWVLISVLRKSST